MQLILIRHPQPLIAPGICYGRTDVAVSPAQMAMTLAELTPTMPRGLPLYSSPLQRCSSLAKQLAEQLAAPPPILDARLVEMDFGSWEMQPWDAIPRPGIDAWAADLVNYQPGGGESVLQMAGRVSAFLSDLRRDQADAIVVCHAGTMRLLSACHAGLPLIAAALQAAQTPHQIAYGATLTLQS